VLRRLEIAAVTIRDVLESVGHLERFAKRSGLSYSTLRRIRRAGVRPGLETLRGIERGLVQERDRLTEALGAVRTMIERKVR